MKKQARRLHLHRETLVALNFQALPPVAGATNGNQNACIDPNTTEGPAHTLSCIPCQYPVVTYPWC